MDALTSCAYSSAMQAYSLPALSNRWNASHGDVPPGTVRGVSILAIAEHLPSRVRTSGEIEEMIAAQSPHLRLRPGLIELRTGIQSRRVAEDHEQCSDLALAAARAALESANMHSSEVDLLVFAAAGQDLIEPATAHIVQQKLGTSCAVFDIKNACNSFLNGLQVAAALVANGAARTALVVTGEICSRAARYDMANGEELRRYFPGFTMGDAGAAVVLQRSGRDIGLRYCGFESLSEHWSLATISSGGSMHPRGDEFAYLAGDGPALKNAFVKYGPSMLKRLMSRACVSFEDVDRILVHQVGVRYHAEMLRATGIPPEKVECTVEQFGNMASASLPVAHAIAVANGTILPGERVMWVGMASGMSVGLAVIDT